jgi:hypothetical protein
LRKPNLKLAKHPDDLLRRVYLPGHIVLHSEFRNSRIRSVNMDPFHGSRPISFMTSEDGLSTKGSTGKLVLHMLGAVAQFERDLILERTRAGLAATRKRGKRLGPPIKWQADMAKRARNLMQKDGLNADEAARVLGVSRRTLFRGLMAARDNDELAAAAKHAGQGWPACVV